MTTESPFMLGPSRRAAVRIAAKLEGETPDAGAEPGVALEGADQVLRAADAAPEVVPGREQHPRPVGRKDQIGEGALPGGSTSGVSAPPKRLLRAGLHKHEVPAEQRCPRRVVEDQVDADPVLHIAQPP